MTKFNINCLETKLQSDIDGIDKNSEVDSIAKTGFASTCVSTNRKLSVATGDDLPDLGFTNDIANGTIVFVEKIGLPVVKSNFKWIGLDGRVYRDDTPRGEIYGWGRNCAGQIGDGNIIDKSSPVQEISSSTDWCRVASGYNHNLTLKTSGTLWSWGNNLSGQIGDATTIYRSSPVQEITSSADWCQVAGGTRHSLAIKTSGTLWAWGGNSPFANLGVLGTNDDIDRSSPVQEISSSTDWSQVSAYRHSLALKTSGTIWAWGRNSCGAIGDGTTIDRSSPVQEISSSTDWCQISSGEHSLALKTSGTLWTWGNNNKGEIGDGTSINRSSPVQEVSLSTEWLQVSGSGEHSRAIKTNGTIWSWGDNDFGELGDGTTINRSSPVQEISSSTEWLQVSSGRHSSRSLKTNGTLWGWGSNFCGNMGDGTTINRSSPVQEVSLSTDWLQVSSGEIHSLAIKKV